MRRVKNIKYKNFIKQEFQSKNYKNSLSTTSYTFYI